MHGMQVNPYKNDFERRISAYISTNSTRMLEAAKLPPGRAKVQAFHLIEEETLELEWGARMDHLATIGDETFESFTSAIKVKMVADVNNTTSAEDKAVFAAIAAQIGSPYFGPQNARAIKVGYLAVTTFLCMAGFNAYSAYAFN